MKQRHQRAQDEGADAGDHADDKGIEAQGDEPAAPGRLVLDRGGLGDG